MLKSFMSTIKRKIYLSKLKKINPKQYEIEFKYSPERTKRKFNFKEWIEENSNFLGSIFGFLALLVSLIALLHSYNII